MKKANVIWTKPPNFASSQSILITNLSHRALQNGSSKEFNRRLQYSATIRSLDNASIPSFTPAKSLSLPR